MKMIFYGLLLFLILSFTVQEYNVEGLNIEFKKVTYVSLYMYDGQSLTFGNNYSNGTANSLVITKAPEIPNEGFIFEKLKLILTNTGKADCMFDLNNVFISTKRDSLYPFSFTDNRLLTRLGIKSQTIIKIEPNKSITKTIYFEFPDNEEPKELYIENRKFKIEKK
jgi:hypothetical protein